MVRWAAAFVFVMLLVGGASAVPAKQLQAPWALMVPEEVGFDENGTGASLYPLGDVDGDGYADLLAVNQSGSAFALAGPELERIIWDAPFSGGWALAIPDADGDGVRDVWGYGEPSFRYSGQSVSQQGVSASQQEYTSDWPEQVLSGASGKPLATLRDSSSSTSANGRAFVSGGPVYVYTYASLSQGESVYDMIGGVDQVWSIEVASKSVRGWAFTSTNYVSQRQGLESVSVASSDLGGEERFRVTFDDPTRSLMYLAFTEVTGDGVVDMVAVTVPRPVQGPEGAVSLGADEWTVYDGTDGSVTWRVTGEPVVRLVDFRGLYLAPLGDVDGDGRPDLVAAEYEYGSMGFDESARIISGADGSTLLQAQPSTWFFPFGDATGDGVPEFLKIRESSSMDGYELELSSLTSSLWKLDVAGFAEPMNFNSSMEDDFVVFSDLTGDGVPDLLMWDWTDDPWDDPKAAALFFLIDGSTGEELWRDEVGPILGATASLDATGDGLDDLVYVAGREADGNRSGYFEGTNHSMEMVVHRASDGKHAWTRTIIDPSVTGGRNITRVDGWPMPAGDIDGDGHGDVLVEMWNNCEYYFEFIEFDEIQSVRPDEGEACDTFAQWLVISGRDASLLHAVPVLASGGDPLPGVQKGEAFLDVESETKGVPLPLPLLLVGIVLAGLRRRR